MAAIPRETPDLHASTLDRRLDLTRVNLEVVAFVGLVLLSIIAHLWALGNMALHHDESIHAWSSWRFFTGAGGFTCAGGRTAATYCYDPVFHGPSLYSLTMFSYLLFGVGDAQARLPMALAGIGMVASTWMLRPYFGRWGMFIAAALLAFSPSLLYYTRFARHDGLMVLWEFWMVLGFFRWLDTGRARYLYLLSIGAALAIATHELYYILFFLFGAFVLIRVLSELLPARKLTIGMLVLLVITVVIALVNPPITERLNAGGLALLMATVVGVGLLMLRVWETTPLLTARALVLWRHRRNELWIALGILAAIYVLLYSTYFADPPGIIDGLYQGISYWLGSQHDYARGDQPWYYYLMLVPLYEPLALLVSIGAAIYLFTRRPPTNRATSHRRPDRGVRPTRHATNDDAAAKPTRCCGGRTRRHESVAETIEAGGESEDSTSPAHPLTPVTRSGRTRGAALRRLTRSPLHQRAAAAVPGVLVPRRVCGVLVGWREDALAAGAYRPAGEPAGRLGAWPHDRLQRAAAGRRAPILIFKAQRSKILLIPLATVLLLVFMAVAIWRLCLTPREGLEGQTALLQGLIPLLVGGALIYTDADDRAERRRALDAGAVGAVYRQHPDSLRGPRDMDGCLRPPRHAARAAGVRPELARCALISRQIHELAVSQTRNDRSTTDPIGGSTMPIIMDIGDEAGEYSLSWPYYWYFRDMQRLEGRKADFFQNATAESFEVAVDPQQPDGEKELAPVVMVSVPHMTEATRQALEANYVKRWSSNLNWWFPYGNKCDPQAPGYSRFYYSTWTSAAVIAQPAPKGCGPTTLDPEQFKQEKQFESPLRLFTWPFEPANARDNWRFLLYREIPAPLEISGRQMEVWVRSDLAGGATPGATTGGSSQLKLVAEQVFGDARPVQPAARPGGR